MLRLSRIFAALAALLAIAPVSRAQYIGQVSPLTVQSTLATAVSCTGTTQTYTVPNLGQTQHWVTFSYVNTPTRSQVQIVGVDTFNNQNIISDTSQAGPSAIAGVNTLYANGYFPKIQVLFSCLGGTVTYNVSYLGASASTAITTGQPLVTAIDKVLFNQQPANATSFSPGLGTGLNVPPYGNASGVIYFKYGSAGPSGSTLGVTCGGSTVSSQPTGSNQLLTMTFTLATAATTQLFPIPPSPCPFYTILYTSGGASAAAFDAEYFFNNPGNPTGFGGDPCQIASNPKTSVPINITTATTTQLVALSGTTTIYACGVTMTIAPSGTSADTATFEYGTGASCGTGTTVLTGAFGAGDLTTATGVTPITFADPGTTFKTAAGNALCLLSAGTTVNIQGVLTYVQQ
jgi:hypothetical protein